MQRISILIAIGALIAVVILFPNMFQETKYSYQNSAISEIVEEETEPLLIKRTNILVLGNDSRPGETKSRSDTIMLVSLDQETNQLAILSIPRDTRVEIPGRGYDKINSAYYHGGPQLATEAVEELLNIQVDYYVSTNFEGFKNIIDILGGVSINVPQRMYYPAEGINLKKGEQILDGDMALQFVRFRSYPLGDITRVEQQQLLVKAIVKQSLQLGNLSKLPRLFPQFEQAVETNFRVSDTIFLMRLIKHFESPNIVSSTLPGNFLKIRGVDYWQVDPVYTQETLNSLFSGQTTDKIVLAP